MHGLSLGVNRLAWIEAKRHIANPLPLIVIESGTEFNDSIRRDIQARGFKVKPKNHNRLRRFQRHNADEAP